MSKTTAAAVSRILSKNGERPVAATSMREGIVVKNSGDRVYVAALIDGDDLAAQRSASCQEIMQSAGYTTERTNASGFYVTGKVA